MCSLNLLNSNIQTFIFSVIQRNIIAVVPSESCGGPKCAVCIKYKVVLKCGKAVRVILLSKREFHNILRPNKRKGVRMI